MWFSVRSAPITPTEPVHLEGFASRTELSIGVHDELYATVAVLKASDTLILASMDLLRCDRAFGSSSIRAIAKACGVPQSNVLLSHTHTHGAVSARLGSDADGKARAYARRVRRTLIELAKACVSSLEEGSLRFARAESDFGVSRRLPDGQGGVLWRPNHDPAARDSDLFALRVDDSNDTARLLFYSYACHPTACGSDNLHITAEYPGAVRTRLRELHPGLEVMFLQGCGADVKPLMSAVDGMFTNVSPEKMTEGAAKFAGELDGLLAGGSWEKLVPDFRAARWTAKLPVEVWPESKWRGIRDSDTEPAYRREAAAAALIRRARGELTDSLSYPMQCLGLSDSTRIIALSCEVPTGIGKMIKSAIPGNTITLGYTYFSSGYIPTAAMMREGGYETESFLGMGTAGPLRPEAERVILKTAHYFYRILAHK